MQYLTPTSILLYRWRITWLSLRSIMSNLSQQDELNSLIAWARRRRLHQVQRAYAWRLHHLEERLWCYRMRNRGLVVFGEFLLTAYRQVAPAPRFYQQGSGAKYRV